MFLKYFRMGVHKPSQCFVCALDILELTYFVSSVCTHLYRCLYHNNFQITSTLSGCGCDEYQIIKGKAKYLLQKTVPQAYDDCEKEGSLLPLIRPLVRFSPELVISKTSYKDDILPSFLGPGLYIFREKISGRYLKKNLQKRQKYVQM